MGKRDSNDNAKVQAVADALAVSPKAKKLKAVAAALVECNAYQLREFVLPELGAQLPAGLGKYIQNNYGPNPESDEHAMIYKGKGKNRKLHAVNLLSEQLKLIEALPKTDTTAPPITPEIQAVLDDRGMSYEEFLTAAATAHAKRFTIKSEGAEKTIKATLTEQMPLIIKAATEHNEAEPDQQICITGAAIAAITGLRANDVNKYVNAIAGADIAVFNERYQVNQYSNRGKDVPALLSALMAD